MIDEKIVTPNGLFLLWRIMRTCPATPFNGGEDAKKHLQNLCKKRKSVSGSELRAGIVKKLSCECEKDVFEHLLTHTQTNTIDWLEVMEYFGGDIHAKKILSSAKEDGLSHAYALKVAYGHLLIPIVINDPDELSAIDSCGIAIEHLLVFSDDKSSYAQGDVVLMHYGFIIGKILSAEMDILSAINQKSTIYLEAIKARKGIDFATMHYFPRSKKIAGK